MRSVVDEGLALLAASGAAQGALAEQLDAEARERQLLMVGTAQIVELLTTIVNRLAVLEQVVAATHQQVLATRYRRLVRDASGMILYAIDEAQPPNLEGI